MIDALIILVFGIAGTYALVLWGRKVDDRN